MKTACAVTIEPNKGRIDYFCVSAKYECDFFRQVIGEPPRVCKHQKRILGVNDRCHNKDAQEVAIVFSRDILIKEATDA